MADLSVAERVAMEVALRRVPRSRGAAPGFEDGWLAARDYYCDPKGERYETATEQLEQTEARERVLREALNELASDASLCDSAEKLEELTRRLLALAASSQPKGGRGRRSCIGRRTVDESASPKGKAI